MARYFNENMSYEEAYFYLVDTEENGYLTDIELEEFRDAFDEIAPRLRRNSSPETSYGGPDPGD